MNIQHYLKSLITFWKPGVGRRLTIYFTITGLLVGYVSVIIFATITTKDFIRAAGNIILHQYSSIDQAGEGDFVWRSINTRKSEFATVVKVLKGLSSPQYSIGKLELFCFIPPDHKWYSIYIDDTGLIHRRNVIEAEKAYLEKCLCRPFSYQNPFFWGKKKTSILTMDITGPRDKNRYLLKIQIDRQGLTAMMGHNRFHFILLTSVILVFSHLLGHLFAWRIAMPIEILSDGAAALARGEYHSRFKVDGKDEFALLASSLNSMAEQTEKHIADITDKMNAMETMNRIDKATLSSLSRSELINRVIGIVSSFLPEYSICLALRNDEKQRIDVISHYDARSRELCADEHFIDYSELDRRSETTYCELFQLTGTEMEKSMPLIIRRVLGTETGSVINYPVFISGEFLGSFVVSRAERTGFTQNEVSTISMLADQTGVALQSVRLFEDREKLFMGVLLALSRAIDAKSRWTAGHSERVSGYCERIGEKLGLSVIDMKTLRMSAILHDIGKIGVPEYILDKPDKLTDEEFNTIKQHCQKGADIIGDVPFYDAIKNGILYHHERYDGSGYPKGLSKDTIPENARIIAIADVYDALTYDRPYRSGWPDEKARTFLVENRGSLFDPRITDAFLAVLEDTPSRIMDPSLS